MPAPLQADVNRRADETSQEATNASQFGPWLCAVRLDSLLRGLTPARVGLVIAVCALQTAAGRQSRLLFGKERPPLDVVTLTLLDDLWPYVLNVSPALLLTAIADNLSARWTTVARVASLTLAVTLGAAIFAWLEYDPDPDELAYFGALRVLVADFAAVLSWGGLLMGALYFLERERRTWRSHAPGEP